MKIKNYFPKKLLILAGVLLLVILSSSFLVSGKADTFFNSSPKQEVKGEKVVASFFSGVEDDTEDIVDPKVTLNAYSISNISVLNAGYPITDDDTFISVVKGAEKNLAYGAGLGQLNLKNGEVLTFVQEYSFGTTAAEEWYYKKYGTGAEPNHLSVRVRAINKAIDKELIIQIDTEEGEKNNVYLPKIPMSIRHMEVYIGEDGSTYYSRQDHGCGNADLSPEEAIVPQHLAKKAYPYSGAKLKASVDNVSNTLNIVPGTSDALFTDIILDATGSSEDIRVTRFDFTHKVSKPGIQQYITNIILYDDGKQLNVPKSGSGDTLTLILTSPLIISKDTSKTISLIGNVSASAEAGTTHQFIIDNEDSILAFGNTSNDQVKPTGDYPLNSTLVKILSAGKFTLSDGSGNPASAIYNGGSSKKNIGSFGLNSSLEDVEITNLIFKSEGLNGAKLNNTIKRLYLYHGSTLIAEKIPVMENSVTFNIPSDKLIIYKGTMIAIITIKADFYNVGQLEVGDSGNGLILNLDAANIGVVGKTTGKTYSDSEKQGTYSSNKFYLTKSRPFITKVNLSGMANGTQDLYKFSMAADSAGDIALYKVSYKIETSGGVKISNINLYEVVGPIETLLNNNPAEPSARTEMYVETSDYSIVDAGTSKNYLLRGDVTGWHANASIYVTMLADEGDNVLEPATASQVDNAVGTTFPKTVFIWSDLCLGGLDALNLAQWLNGRLVYKSTMQAFAQGTPLVIQPITPQPAPVVEPEPSPVVQPSPIVEPAPAPVVQPQPTQIAQRLKGRLLLQVQQGGAIWYVDHVNHQKHNVTWENALPLFEKFALGITDADLVKIPASIESIQPDLDTDGDGYTDKDELEHNYSPYTAGAHLGKFSLDTNLANRLKGRLLLQVQQGGAIWYVDQDGMRHNVRWSNLMDLFRALALGITDSDLGEIVTGN